MLRPPPLPPSAANQSRPTLNLFGIKVDNLPQGPLLEAAVSLFSAPNAVQLITANALLFQEIQRVPELQKVCDEAHLVVSDSIGLSWMARLLHQTTLHRYPGIDLALDLCGMAERKKAGVFLLGGEPGRAEASADFLKKKFPDLLLTGTHHGFFKDNESDQIIARLRESRSQLVLVALGMPRQDLWIHRHLDRLPSGLYMGVGGTFDIWSGHLKRAPNLMQKYGVEWLYRLAQEPSRWRRMAELPQFVRRVVKSWIAKNML